MPGNAYDRGRRAVASAAILRCSKYLEARRLASAWQVHRKVSSLQSASTVSLIKASKLHLSSAASISIRIDICGRAEHQCRPEDDRQPPTCCHELARHSTCYGPSAAAGLRYRWQWLAGMAVSGH